MLSNPYTASHNGIMDKIDVIARVVQSIWTPCQCCNAQQERNIRSIFLT